MSMRVGRGGGPRATGGAKGAGAAGKVGGTKFSGLVTGAGAVEDSTEKARAVRNMLLEELSGLANDVKDGKATKEEATRKFVHLVIKEKMAGATAGKGQKAMEESVSEMCENDPNFVNRLHGELLKLSRS